MCARSLNMEWVGSEEFAIFVGISWRARMSAFVSGTARSNGPVIVVCDCMFHVVKLRLILVLYCLRMEELID